MKEIRFYKSRSERSPVEDFLISLPVKARQKVVYVLKIIRELDRVPAEYLKKLKSTEGIWEVRVKFGNNIYRLLGFFEKNNLIILVSGFTKKSQKTPKQEILLAQKRKRDYLNRKR